MRRVSINHPKPGNLSNGRARSRVPDLAQNQRNSIGTDLSIGAFGFTVNPGERLPFEHPLFDRPAGSDALSGLGRLRLGRGFEDRGMAFVTRPESFRIGLLRTIQNVSIAFGHRVDRGAIGTVV
jgi:hypothetical protein